VGDVARTAKPTKEVELRLKAFEPDDIVIRFRRGQSYTIDKQGDLERRAVSIETVYGSVHERIFYRELLKRGYRPYIDFIFQASVEGAHPKGTRAGGRLLGGLVADFAFVDRPLVVWVQGTFWHAGREAELRDQFQVQRLAEAGWQSEFLWDWQIESAELLEEWMRANIDLRAPHIAPDAAFRL
jgi:hypothetical protein